MKKMSKPVLWDALFCVLMLAYPLIHFSIFYIGVNFSSFTLAFKTYYDGEFVWAGFENFRLIVYNFQTQPEYGYAVVNSLINYGVGIIVGVPLSLIFSFFIYKKVKGYTIYRVLLFLPSVIPGIVMVLIYSYFVERALPELIPSVPTRLLSSEDTAYMTILVFCIFTSFGPTVLMYSSTMSGINQSMVESAELDGITFFKEFFYITIPSIWPTITTFLVSGIAGIFVNQMSLFSFKGTAAPIKISNFGYFLYRETQADMVTHSTYPYLSAMGLAMTVIVVPLTLLAKFLLEKYGPKND